jgi:hypothetical protein
MSGTQELTLNMITSYIVDIGEKKKQIAKEESQTNKDNDTVEDNDDIFDSQLPLNHLMELKSATPNLTDLFGEYFSKMQKVYVRPRLTQAGVTIDISLYSSILALIYPDSLKFTSEQINVSILSIISSLTKEYVDGALFTIFKYSKLKIRKNDLFTHIKNCDDTHALILHLSNVFFLNIFLLDFDTDSLIVYYHEESYDPYKNSVMLMKDDGTYKPILYDSLGLIKADNRFLTDLLENNDNGMSFKIYPEKGLILSDRPLDSFVDTQIGVYHGQDLSFKSNTFDVVLNKKDATIQNIQTEGISDDDIDISDDDSIFVPKKQQTNSKTTKKVITKSKKTPIPTLNYTDMTAKQLRDLARANNITITSGKKYKTKIELCEELNKCDA